MRRGAGKRRIKATKAHYSRSHLPKGHPVRQAAARRARMERAAFGRGNFLDSIYEKHHDPE